jgi:hypothetical protein
MKAIEFPEVNVRIAENQEEYETIPVYIRPDLETKGYFSQATACFELDQQERAEVAETGQIWLTILNPNDQSFHPIMMSIKKPEI